MKILSFGPPSSQRPYVPKYVYSEDSLCFEDGSMQLCSQTRRVSSEYLTTPIDLPPDHWIAILEGGSVETFPREKSKDWAIKKAIEMVSSVMEPTGDPLGRIEVIQQAATLIGMPIQELVEAVSHFGGKDVSLEEAFLRMQEKITQ